MRFARVRPLAWDVEAEYPFRGVGFDGVIDQN